MRTFPQFSRTHELKTKFTFMLTKLIKLIHAKIWSLLNILLTASFPDDLFKFPKEEEGISKRISFKVEFDYLISSTKDNKEKYIIQ